MKKETTGKEEYVFKTIKPYSPEEVFAAGGTTAFALKYGKTRDALTKVLENEVRKIKPEEFVQFF